jgi:hypothetical protein
MKLSEITNILEKNKIATYMLFYSSFILYNLLTIKKQINLKVFKKEKKKNKEEKEIEKFYELGILIIIIFRSQI